MAEKNTFGLPQGEPIRRALVRAFRRQRAAVLDSLGGKDLAGDLPRLTWLAPDWREETDRMAAEMTPILTAYWDASGRDLFATVGLDPENWRVVDPNVRKQIEGAAFEFCEATNATTSYSLMEARLNLARELTEGVVFGGDTTDELTKRVKAVFRDAETWRARRIATTEAARAIHAAELESSRQSGVVLGLEWLLSADACPLCQAIAERVGSVRLGEPFATTSEHPSYGTVRYPPAHPHCQCSVTHVLKPEYGGPPLHKFGSGLPLDAVRALHAATHQEGDEAGDQGQHAPPVHHLAAQ